MLTKTYSDKSLFEKRRAKLNERTDSAVFIFFAGEEGHWTRFRPQRNFLYLTGFEEPEACAVIRTGEAPSFHLFVREKDPSIEIWDGPRFGPELAKREFGADECYSINELSARLPELLRGVDQIFYTTGDNADQDQMILDARLDAQQLDRRSGRSQASIHDPNQVMGWLRMVKDEQEQNWMRESCALSANAHKYVMENVKAGMNERQVQAYLFKSFYEQEAMCEGYFSIIASGANATILHYRANNRLMNDGDFLLIDAGAEKNYYTADITRTYPVNGKFTSAQKDLYQSVLDVQKKLIECVQPGFSLPELQDRAVALLTERMVELGLLSGTVQDLIDDGSYKKYYPHGVGHFLGMDVHDIGFAKHKNDPVKFEEGVVITVEPGLYIPENDESAPKELRGLGVRIEDDVLVGATGPEVMTSLAPKEVSELEDIIQSS